MGGSASHLSFKLPPSHLPDLATGKEKEKHYSQSTNTTPFARNKIYEGKIVCCKIQSGDPSAEPSAHIELEEKDE